jgi:hypothetical protein
VAEPLLSAIEHKIRITTPIAFDNFWRFKYAEPRPSITVLKTNNLTQNCFVGSCLASPGPQRRFAAHMEGLANAAGYADRHTPLKNYLHGVVVAGRTQERRANGSALGSRRGSSCTSRSII